MSNPTALVQKLWNYCNILRDDGLSYGDLASQARLQMSKGVYLAKLTFVGADAKETLLGKFLALFRTRVKRASNENFWSQIYGFSVH